MDAISQQLSQLLQKINLAAVADVIIVTLLVYGLLSLLQGTRANQVLRGTIILLLGLFLVSAVFRLPVLGWIVNNSLPALFLVLAVIFAPELRRALEQIGHTGDIFQRPLSAHSRDSLLLMIQEVGDACVYLSNQHWGGLIVIERNTGLQDLIVNGQIINGRVSSALLETIFMINSELHDGAVIIRGDRIVAAHVTLPLADNFGTRQHLGHRHKAALGITEETDAVSVIVSEETGNISVAYNGEMLQRLTKEKLREILISLLQPSLIQENQHPTQTRFGRMTNLLRSGLQRDNEWRNSIKHPGTPKITRSEDTKDDHISRSKTKSYPERSFTDLNSIANGKNGNGTASGKLPDTDETNQVSNAGNKYKKG